MYQAKASGWQSSDRGRPCSKVDNPSGQLPEAGIPSGIDSGLYGFSLGTSRRRDSSVPERSHVRTSESGVSAGGSDLLCLIACQVVFHLLEQFRT